MSEDFGDNLKPFDIIPKEVNFLSEHRRDCKCTKAISLVVTHDPTLSVDPPQSELLSLSKLRLTMQELSGI
jgi:hypothetical protein